MSDALQMPAWMSVAEFLAWEPGDGRRWQLVDGMPQAMAPGSRTHGSLQAELARQLGNHFADRGSPCVVVDPAGVVPQVNAARNFRIPDLAVTCTGYDAEEYTVADPVLIVEILSPSNAAQTWANVWTYTTIPSVQEILILRSDIVAADLLRRLPDGGWPREPETITGGDLVLASVGFSATLAGVYRTTRLA